MSDTKKYSIRFTLLVLVGVAAITFAQEKRIVRVWLQNPQQIALLQQNSFDLATPPLAGHIDIVVDDRDEARLLSLGFTFRTMPIDAPALHKAMVDSTDMGRYHTYAEMVLELKKIVQQYPQITRLHTIGRSIENRTIYAIKVSDHPELEESDEPSVLYIGNIHARETITPELLFYFLNYLINHYGPDERVTRIINSRQLWLVPTMNPDGHVQIENGNIWWRKNRRLNPDSSFGVDLNRNFSFKWGYDNLGSSSATDVETFRGPAALSEPEAQAIRDLVKSRRFVAALCYHSYGRLWLYPWSYDYRNTPHHEVFMEMGRQMTAANDYEPGNSAMGTIYLVNGDTDDYFYGELFEKNRIFGFSPEVGNTFHQREESILRLVDENLPANLYLAETAGLLEINPNRVPLPVAPAVTTSTVDDAGRWTLRWRPSPDSLNQAISFEVQELSGYTTWTDSAETASPVLDFFNFQTSATQFFNGQKSYYSATVFPIRSNLTWRYPFVVKQKQRLSFKAWYRLEAGYDYFYVQASRDQGKNFINLAGNRTRVDNPYGRNIGNGITGSSDGWVTMDFDLNPFVNEEILLRIRHFTEGDVAYGGLYVDEIGPLYLPRSEQTLAKATSDTSLLVEQTRPGWYGYRVRSTDMDDQQSYWSPVKMVQVDFGLQADVNRDQVIDQRDVLRCAELVVEKGAPAGNGEQWRANLDGSLENDHPTITVLDVVRMTRLLPATPTLQKSTSGRTFLRIGEASGKPGDTVRIPVFIVNEQILAGLQWQIRDQLNGLRIDSVVAAESTKPLIFLHNKNRVLFFSPQNQPLATGEYKLGDLLFTIPIDFPNGNDSLFFSEPTILSSREGSLLDSVFLQAGRLNISGTTVVAAAAAAPLEYQLEQNYPNPFNDQTTVRFSLKEAGWVSMKLYDVTGREIKTVRQGFYERGLHQFMWKADALATGVYFFSMKVNDYSLKRKVLVLK